MGSAVLDITSGGRGGGDRLQYKGCAQHAKNVT